MSRNKNDRNDAWSPVRLLRSGWFKAVHVKPIEGQELRAVLVAREFFVNKLRDHENEIRGPKKAKSAAARKLAVVIHRMWRDDAPFRWDAAG